jgi:acetyl-CoA acetyltransferase
MPEAVILWNAVNGIHVGITELYDFTREEQDELAAAGQRKPRRAIGHGVFDDEIVPVKLADSPCA